MLYLGQKRISIIKKAFADKCSKCQDFSTVVFGVKTTNAKTNFMIQSIYRFCKLFPYDWKTIENFEKCPV